MKKNLAILLVVATLFTCLLGFSASAEGTPSIYYEVSMVTVPMRAAFSILFAIEIDKDVNVEAIDREANPEAYPQLRVYKVDENGEPQRDMDATAIQYKGILELDGKEYWVFEYTNISASEVETTIRAKVGAQPDTLAKDVSVAQFLRSYDADTNNLEADRNLARKMLAYGQKAAAWAAAQ